ncbi:hypothetical protein SAMN02983003_3159 [Devosia enhydra]|uniref:Uncharacterized protein n=1 Tax=Devosia enhydra TaxID=665118 RepID=A0A1K2I194_9HYPH|nr:DUF2730 family protein [Devosia enhydra]SFZ85987.1 hypothetical protein SAMN02983003_3159 [Devosia enhydra]
MEFLREWVGLGIALLSLSGTVWALLQSPAKKNAEDLAELRKAAGTDFKRLDERQDELERRTAKMEGDWKHLPDKESVHRLELAISDMNGTIKSMAASSEATERTARRVEEFLITQKHDLGQGRK